MNDINLNEYRPQGMGHIIQLGGIVTAGMMLVSFGGSLLFAAPLAGATVWKLFRGAKTAQDPNWCKARDELWDYKLSPKHKSIAEDYEQWVKDWGLNTINRMIEPMIGQCVIANFVQDKTHPYHGLRGVLVYDHDEDDLPPLTPHDYISRRLEQRQQAMERAGAITVEATEIRTPTPVVLPQPTAPAPEPTPAPTPPEPAPVAETITPTPPPTVLAEPTPTPTPQPTPEPTLLATAEPWQAFSYSQAVVEELPPLAEEPAIDLPMTAEELRVKLKDECPRLLGLVKSHPIRLIGHQRLGKSTFARLLVLLRGIYLPGHKIWWATPNKLDDLPPDYNPIGYTKDGKDYSRIERLWEATQRGIDAGNYLNQTVVWDEFGGYGAFECTFLLKEGLRSMLQESIKHGYRPILIAHGDQVSFYPGVEGVFNTLKGGTIKVEAIGAPDGDLGEMKPTGRYKVTGMNGETASIFIPDWLTEDLLLQIYRTTTGKAPVHPDPPPPPTKLYANSEEVRAKLEQLYSTPTELTSPDSGDYPSELHGDLAGYLAGKGEIPMRKLRLNWQSGKVKTEEIKPLLDWFVDQGKVEIYKPEGSQAEWVRWLQ